MDAVALTGSLAACAVMVGAATLTGWRLDAVSRRGGGADDYFWVGFGGVVVIAAAGLVGGSLGGGGAVLAVVVGIVSVVATVAWSWHSHARRSRAADEAAAADARADLRRRHAAVVRRWADYDVDPGKAIHYPAMHDPRHPVGRPVVRALRAADAARDDPAPPDPECYAAAVDRLERAFATAEHEIGRSTPDPESLPGNRSRGTFRG
ncbi:hypothetical protein [Arthrobacter agilis]|uniref:hypothetical protein n=1 Tax=Arthrobacter agilis TaxID=37921 RepID=UPI00277EBEDA|nr:hypothetical protein [Arthrobacter agilis]MDQ0736785.1 NhaP-type Na+/H+ or K+/H+ antiporter [Arthrobacter agilis]